MNHIRIYPFFCFLLLSIFANGQNDYVVISSIDIDGNNRTKRHVITRELDFIVGDSISLNELAVRNKLNEDRVMNTGMFVTVRINLKDWDNEKGTARILIEVAESWYIYPVPIFELADRNFNIWWVEQDHKLDRVNYGLRLYHLNTSGNADRIKLAAQFGYTRKFEIDYNFPYLNKSNTLGSNINVLYSENKELSYNTIADRLQFHRQDDRILFKRWRFNLGFNYRKKLLQRHALSFSYNQHEIDPFVIDSLNNEFLLDNRTEQQFFSIRYLYSYDSRDIRPYPEQGTYLTFGVNKEGLGVFGDHNSLVLHAGAEWYTRFKKPKWSFYTKAKISIDLIDHSKAYYNNRGLGYGGDFIRGYEYYVIDGNEYGYLKSAVRYKLLENTLSFGKLMPIKAFRDIPFRIFFTFNTDLGYVVNISDSHPSNTLKNKSLLGGGIGMDIVFYYDKLIRLEYSGNQLGEKDLFLQIKLSI